MASSDVVQQQMSSRLASLAYAPGSDINFLENQQHSVLNVYSNDIATVTPLGVTPTAFNGSQIKFNLYKYMDCFNRLFMKVVTNAAAGATNQAFVQNAGFVMFPRSKLVLTNNDYTANFPAPYMNFDRQRLVNCSRQWLQHQEETMMIGRPLAYRQAALAQGHTFIVDLELGHALKAFENAFWVSPLAHELIAELTLCNDSDIINAPAGSSAGLTNLGTLINSMTMHVDNYAVDDDARANVIAMYNTDDGIYNFIRDCHVYTQTYLPTATGASGGELTFNFNETRPVVMYTLFFECVDKVDVPWRKSPFDIQGPSMIDNGLFTVNFPTHFELVSGEQTLIKKRAIDVQRSLIHRTKFEDREAGDWIINIPCGTWDPLKDNSINGSYDPNVWPQLTFKFTMAAETATGGSGLKCTLLCHLYNFTHISHADAAKILS
jgi:hypothetical protein